MTGLPIVTAINSVNLGIYVKHEVANTSKTSNYHIDGTGVLIVCMNRPLVCDFDTSYPTCVCCS